MPVTPNGPRPPKWAKDSLLIKRKVSDARRRRRAERKRERIQAKKARRARGGGPTPNKTPTQ